MKGEADFIVKKVKAYKFARSMVRLCWSGRPQMPCQKNALLIHAGDLMMVGSTGK